MSIKVIFNNLTLVLLVIVLSGCASIVSKSKYPVRINSSPEGSIVTIKNKSGQTVYRGKTPTLVSLDAGSGYFQSESYTLNFKKKGFKTQTSVISADMDGWYIGNILFGGLIGFLIIDPATGSMWKLNESVHVSFGPRVLDRKNTLDLNEL